MKKGCLGLSSTVLVLLGILVVLALWAIPKYNGLVKQQESVEKAWGNVENQYQRRADLIPNLVETVKGYAKHEQETFEKVIQARANATSIKIDPSNITPEELQKYLAAQGELTSALSRLIAVSEAYPDLKAHENFKELQSQLEGTENRISIARMDFNNACQQYNMKIRQFPYNLMGFDTKAYFETSETEEKTPEVDFNLE